MAKDDLVAKICPECGHVFQGCGWDGIDAHWKAKHGKVMPYSDAWPLIKAGTYAKADSPAQAEKFGDAARNGLRRGRGSDQRLTAEAREAKNTDQKALSDVVGLGGLALQSEDCAIRAAVACRNEHGGIVRMENERFHQFVIWRALLPVWNAFIEKQNATDLVLEADKQTHYFELKNWRQETIPAIQKDITKLRHREKGYVIVTSGNPLLHKPHHTDENIGFLKKRLVGIEESTEKVYRFQTVDKKGDDFEYWIAGWKVISEKT